MKILERYPDSIHFATEGIEYWLDFDEWEILRELPRRITHSFDSIIGGHGQCVSYPPTIEDADEQVLIDFIKRNEKYWEKAE